MQGADSGHDAGSSIAAGLPNITGSATGGDDWGLINVDGIVSGAIYKGSEMTYTNGGSSGSRTSYYLAIDASRSSSIYGNSNTVQPPALATNFCIKY